MVEDFNFISKGRLPINYGWHINLKNVRGGSKFLCSTFPNLYEFSQSSCDPFDAACLKTSS